MGIDLWCGQIGVLFLWVGMYAADISDVVDE